MKRVAILGGGPAGSFAAAKLAAAGLETIVIDEKLAWEKPCGGGITYKAYEKYPFLKDNSVPSRRLTATFNSARSWRAISGCSPAKAILRWEFVEKANRLQSCVCGWKPTCAKSRSTTHRRSFTVIFFLLSKRRHGRRTV